MAVTPEAQVKVEDTIPQLPLEDFKVNPEPDAVAVMVAHVPLAYHVPALMMHPFAVPPVTAFR